MGVAGRPEKPINWDRVNELLEAGCHGTEICPHFDLTPEAFYERVQKKFGINFSEYSQKKRQKGDSILREKQFKKAIKGDNTLLIWLGKNRLGQKENHQEAALPPLDESLKKDEMIFKLQAELALLKKEINVSQ